MDYQEARRRAEELVGRMTVEEKLSQLLYDSPAIERLGIHEYNWWNEASHGVARAGNATVFPHAIALAATFDPDLIGRIGEAVSEEGRAKYNKSVEFGDRGIYKGLTYWTPNINIFRDPRWGRGQETFGEDPFLTSVLAARYIRGIQGNGPFLKAATCAKHFAVHSGPERTRHSFNAVVSDRDLYETYLPAFEQCVKAGVAGVMGAYNRFDGEPCCASGRLMKILREDWGFKGYFVSDCGAIADISERHHYTDTMTEAAAVSLRAGCQLNCGSAYRHLTDAYEADLITEEEITSAAVGLYTIRHLLGEFEEERPFAGVPFSRLDCGEHRELNLDAARRAVVLLKNDRDYLPLRKDRTPARIAVIGPNALSRKVLEGNYNGTASEYVTVADGIRRVFDRSEVLVAEGSPLCFKDDSHYSEAYAAASEADLVVLCVGLDRTVEGEETGYANDFSDAGDRRTLYLPKIQKDMTERVCEISDNVVVVLMSGGAVDLGEKVLGGAKAVLQAWYPGAEGGLAVAQLIAGMYSPEGRTPVTFYSGDTELPAFDDYAMKGRTYRYAEKPALFPFGYGLSYSKVSYDRFELVGQDGETVRVRVALTNRGKMSLREKIQIYAAFTDSRTPTPVFQLCAVSPVTLVPGESAVQEIPVDRYWLKAVLADGTRADPNGTVRLYAGGHQPDARSAELTGSECLSLDL